MAHPALLRADWPAPPGVRAFTTLRHGAGASKAPFDRFNLGLRSGDALESVLANREELARIASLPAPPAWLHQVHGAAMVRVDAGALASEPEADAAVTSTPGTVLSILTADCLPVLLCSSAGDEVAAAHAGWRGLAAGVLEATVAAMRTPADRVLAWLGPAAGPADYEIGVEVYDAFVSRDWRAGAAFSCTRPNHWRVDLYALARLRLQQAGVDAEAIHGGGLSTIAEPARFYSHRRDARTGRMASVVWFQSGEK